MFKDTSELAENKLLLLYILDKLPKPTSNSYITQVVLENNLINYFSLQRYIAELVENDFILDSEHENSHTLSLTELGERALKLFLGRIPNNKITVIDDYIDTMNSSMEEDIRFETSIVEDEENTLLVLEINNPNKNIARLSFSLNEIEDGQCICDNWENNGANIYSEILTILKSN